MEAKLGHISCRRKIDSQSILVAAWQRGVTTSFHLHPMCRQCFPFLSFVTLGRLVGLVAVWAGARVMTRLGVDWEVAAARAGDGAEFFLSPRETLFSFLLFITTYHLHSFTGT